jgi:uncharacterized protein
VDVGVSALFVYPVKSCRGIAVRRWELRRRGLRYDRRWMIVDGEGVFVTQRNQHRLALVDVTIEGDALRLGTPPAPPLFLPLSPPPGASRRRVRVWRDEVDAVDCGAEAAGWMSEWLGTPVSLVYMPDEVVRPLKPAYANPGDQVGFADGFPLLVASTSSLEDLNARIAGRAENEAGPASALSMRRFRPNIVVTGFPAWAEDDWGRIAVGDISLRIVAPCERCVITTLDPDSAARGVEPLRTLATFRKSRNDVLFAQNAVPETEGTVSVGDPVAVLESAELRASPNAR